MKLLSSQNTQTNLFDAGSPLIAMGLQNGPSYISVILIHLTSVCFKEH